jgi:hypothetical protein
MFRRTATLTQAPILTEAEFGAQLSDLIGQLGRNSD